MHAKASYRRGTRKRVAGGNLEHFVSIKTPSLLRKDHSDKALFRRTNVKVFQIVLEIQQQITRIPGQVKFQQPVYLIDALGKSSPFHLEFIRSPEVGRLTTYVLGI